MIRRNRNDRNLGLFLSLCCLGALLWASTASASVVLHLTDQQMVLRADRVVRAKVIRKVTRWEKATKRIYTYITLVVMDPIKGAKSSQEIEIRQMGGVANGVGMMVPGSAKFNLGEEILVFLEKIKTTKFHHVMGMSYGKFQVYTDPKTKAQTLVRQLKGISLAKRTAKGRLALKHGHAAQAQLKPTLLNDYVNKLRGYLRQARLQKVAPRVTPRIPALRPTKPRTVTPRLVPSSPRK